MSDAWIQTYTGKQFFLLDPDPKSISIGDIAHALSMQCRYNGHVHQFYSVAEHSVLVSRYVPQELKLTALLHDASEAYITDIPRPLKPHLANYKELEERVERVIAGVFGTIYPLPAEVKRVDAAILGDEKDLLMAPEPADWNLPYPRLGIKHMGLPPIEAKEMFIKAFIEYAPNAVEMITGRA
jgi:hypothetical protein